MIPLFLWVSNEFTTQSVHNIAWGLEVFKSCYQYLHQNNFVALKLWSLYLYCNSITLKNNGMPPFNDRDQTKKENNPIRKREIFQLGKGKCCNQNKGK